ncbi:MAG TPA: flagellar motor switch protein FliG, partial [Halieaceae bacterium]|nr:flagellar motor switch protein FliG [Halieaceae bacterium]
DEEQSAQVLVNIPEPVRSEALLRVARLQVIDPAAMEELDKVLEKQLGKVRKT